VDPARVYVEVTRYPILTCRNCRDNNEPTIINPVLKPAVIPGGYASPSLIAWLISEKYGKKVPVYRLEKELKSHGVDISRQLMYNLAYKGFRNVS